MDQPPYTERKKTKDGYVEIKRKMDERHVMEKHIGLQFIIETAWTI